MFNDERESVDDCAHDLQWVSKQQLWPSRCHSGTPLHTASVPGGLRTCLMRASVSPDSVRTESMCLISVNLMNETRCTGAQVLQWHGQAPHDDSPDAQHHLTASVGFITWIHKQEFGPGQTLVPLLRFVSSGFSHAPWDLCTWTSVLPTMLSLIMEDWRNIQRY